MSDPLFGHDFTFRRQDPWEKRMRGQMVREVAGSRNVLPGHRNRALTGLPEDMQPSGTNADDWLNEKYNRNKFELNRAEMAAQDDEEASMRKDLDSRLKETWDEKPNYENDMWRLFLGYKPRGIKGQDEIDAERAARRKDTTAPGSEADDYRQGIEALFRGSKKSGS